MRNFSKTLISMAAVMAVGSAMAAGAMAEEPVTPMSATYNVETGVVTITDAVSNGASNTLLIVKGGANTEATEETIKQIDQVDKDEAFTSAVLGTGLVAGDEYELRVGGTNGTMQSVVFTIPKAEEPVKTDNILVGDVDYSGEVDSLDALYVCEYEWNLWEQNEYSANVADDKELAEDVDGLGVIGDTYYIGDVDYSGEVDSLDALYICEYEWNLWEQNEYSANVADDFDVLVKE